MHLESTATTRSAPRRGGLVGWLRPRAACVGAAAALPDAGQGHAINLQGQVVGLAMPHSLGFRFVSLDASVREMHGSIWPTLRHLSQAAADCRFASLRAGGSGRIARGPTARRR
ncbi:MAG TPA: hypothetical protein VME92_07425 [Acetobacteraceae bacterium]|nr:hypothetical protein [Acetobacteraceae bacterium]